MKVISVRRWVLLFFCRAGPLFLSLLVVKASAQSTASAHLGPTSRVTTIYQQGLAALQKGDLDSARAAFEKVVRLAPQSSDGHNSLGWVLLARDDIDSAISEFQRALKLKPDF